jgi:glycosyltransferase involved in cell wall biosynthesis
MSRPLTILLLLRRVDCNDGVSAYVESLITGLTGLGDRVVIVSGDVATHYGSEPRRRSIEAAAMDWIVLDGFSALRPIGAHLAQLLSVMDRYSVDVLSPQGFAVLPLAFVAARLRGKPIVTNFHLLPGADPASSKPGRLSLKQRSFYRLVNTICTADRYIAMSSDIASFFRSECGIPERRIRVQMLGVDTAFYRVPTESERQAARGRFGLRGGTLAAVLPGRMNATKGHDVAAAAFRLLRADRPGLDTICLFAGDGDQRQMIETAVLRDDADRATFRFLGFVDRDTMREAYWAADLVLLPSRSEGFPLVIIEAMCCGSIVIRTPTSGWQDQVVEAKTGYVVPFNDPAALATAIGKVVDSSDRPGMRHEAMQLATTRFSKSRMIEGTAAIYREADSLRRPARPSLLVETP